MKTQLFKINSLFARSNKLPVWFAANILIETARAYYVHGGGTVESQRVGECCVCGRQLTHPVSVELGIGPECGNHWWNWNLVGGYSKENMERILQLVREEIKIDSWIPKSVVKEMKEAQEPWVTPLDHPMLKKPDAAPIKADSSPKRASQVKYQNSHMLGIKIVFPFDRAVLLQVRTIPGRRFHDEPNAKYWSAPLTPEAVEKLVEFGFELDDALKQYWKEYQKAQSPEAPPVTVEQIPGLKKILYPYQKLGVEFIEKNKGRALIGDEMGLGKTPQTLAWLQLHPKKRPVIIVVPASLKLNWEREADMWMDNPMVQILSGTSASVPIVGEIVIINYDILGDWLKELEKIQAQVLVLDEVHYIKTNSALRTKAVKKLAKTIPHVISLSGTPIENRPVEIYNALHIVNPMLFPSFWTFAQRYCNPKHNGYGWDFNGASNTKELHEKLTQSVMIRRLKKEVLPELPDKTKSFVPMELDNSREYEHAQDNFIHWVRENKGPQAAEKASNAEVLAQIEALKQLSVQGKLKQSIEWIRNHLDVNGKLVVFAVHKFVIDALMNEFGVFSPGKNNGCAVKVDGSVTGEERQKAVDQFQSNPQARLFIGNIKAAGVGITLTASSDIAFLELPWTPGALVQAEDRCHRIGQKNAVNVYYLLANGTVEEQIARLIDDKQQVLNAVLDGTDTEQNSLLTSLINYYND